MPEIPDGEILFRFCRPEALPKDQVGVPPSIFNDPNLSCDWRRYRADPMTSFLIAEGQSVVVEIEVNDDIRNPGNPKRSGEIVPAWRQEIIHDPVSADMDPTHGENPAHSLIRGPKKKAVIDALMKHSRLYSANHQ